MFHPDRPQFECLTDAFEYVHGEYAPRYSECVWSRATSGLVHPREVPRYVFRGECGEFETTMHSLARLRLKAVAGECELSPADLLQLGKIVDWVAYQLSKRLDHLDWPGAFALLQHYGMPTRIVDFTGDLTLAFAFAAKGQSSIGRIAALPNRSTETLQVLEMFDHPWAERAQRQAAYGAMIMREDLADLKSQGARFHLGIKWYQFRILPCEREFLEAISQNLLREANDPSAGFVRFYITIYVEAFGKLSPVLTDWLLSNIPMAPYCGMVGAFEEQSAVVFHRGSEVLSAFDLQVERERSRRYWSLAHPDDHSSERIKNWVLPQPGSIFCDPRTHHPYCS